MFTSPNIDKSTTKSYFDFKKIFEIDHDTYVSKKYVPEKSHFFVKVFASVNGTYVPKKYQKTPIKKFEKK